MAVGITQSAAKIFAPTQTNGAARRPSLAETQRWGVEVERMLDATASNGPVFTSVAAAGANLNWPADTMGWVINATTPTENGVYRKSGASGSGSWLRVGGLPYNDVNVSAAIDAAAQAQASALAALAALQAAESVVTSPANRFASRAAVTVAIIDASVTFITTAGYHTAGDGGGALYAKVGSEPSHAGKVQSADGAWWVLDNKGVANVRQFGAKGDNSTNDYQAFQDAVNYIQAATVTEGGTIYVPRGRYIVGTTIDCSERFISFVGEGVLASQILGDMTSGPVIRFRQEGSGISRLRISATSARKGLGVGGSRFGVWFECDDVAEPAPLNRLWNCYVEKCEIFNQPDNGVVWVASTYGSWMKGCRIRECGRHGILVDDGLQTGRSSAGQLAAGIITFQDVVVQNCGGHALCAGSPSHTVLTPTLRLILDNFDCSGNALSAGTRFSIDQIWLRGTNHEVRGSAVQDGGIRFSGRNFRAINNRYIDTPRSVRIESETGFPTSGVVVEGLTVLDGVNGNYPQAIAVVCDADVSDVRVHIGNRNGITRAITAGIAGAQVDTSNTRAIKVSAQTVNNTVTLADDTVLTVGLSANTRYRFAADIIYDSNDTADIRFAFTVPSGATLSWGPRGGMRLGGSDSFTVQDQITASGTSVVFGAPASGSRVASLVGTVGVGSTAGALTLQFAQGTATAVNTRILAGSVLEVEEIFT